MKITLELPDDLVRTAKIRAVEQNKKLKDMVAELLRRGLGVELGAAAPARRRVVLPLVECAHDARPGDELTPDRLANILLDQEVSRVFP